MLEAHYRVQVERDHLRKLANATPIQAVAELIWNSVDADATRVDLEIDSDGVAMRSVTIRDNGHGIPHTNVETHSGSLAAPGRRTGAAPRPRAACCMAKRARAVSRRLR
jgi:signal transduction histidine kinase